MAVTGNDQMIQHVDAEELAGPVEFHGQRNIRRRGCWISGRVIMDDNDRRSILSHRVLKDFADSHLGLIHAATVDRANCHDLVAGIDENDAQLLVVERRHLRSDQAHRIFGRRDSRPIIRIQCHHAVGKLECRSQARRLGRADPMDRGQLSEIEAHQAAQSARLAQDPLGELDDGLPFRSGVEENGDQFARFELSRAPTEHPLARLLVGRHFPHAAVSTHRSPPRNIRPRRGGL